MSDTKAIFDAAVAAVSPVLTDDLWVGCSFDRSEVLAEIIRSNDSLGFEVLGVGAFSVALKILAHPEYVLKVSVRSEDSAAAYTAYCRDRPSKHLPRIHQVNRVDSDLYFVLLDTLGGSESEFDRGDYHSATAFIRAAFDGSSFDDVKDYWYYLPEHTQDANDPKELFATCREISKFFYGLATIDIHGGNIMLNSDNVIIITDPVSWRKNESRLQEIESTL